MQRVTRVEIDDVKHEGQRKTAPSGPDDVNSPDLNPTIFSDPIPNSYVGHRAPFKPAIIILIPALATS